MDQPVIDGERVRLRPPRPEDADEIAAGADDPQIARFTPALPTPYRRQDAVRWIDQVRAGAFDRINLVITDPGTGSVLGATGLHHLRWDEGTGEIGYWVAASARHRGVATGAVVALTGWGLEHGLERVELLTEPANWISQRVALAAGYRREGIRRGGGIDREGRRRDMVVWARLADDPPGPTPRALPDLPGGELCDGVVRLMPLAAEDADDLNALRRLPDVVATSVPARPPLPGEARRRCAEAASRWLAGERADLTIRDVATGAFTGEIGLYYTDPTADQAMIGYSMLPAWRGRGYPSRAVTLLAGWAFRYAGIARLVAGAAPDNIGSQRVLSRAGFHREGYQRGSLPGPGGTRADDVLYALLPGDLPDAGQPAGATASASTP